MVKRLFIHVGQPKSGTTALQRAFASYSNASDIPQIYYPRAGRRERKIVGHHNLAYELYAPKQFHSKFGSWDDLAQEIAGLDPAIEDVLLSSEAFRGYLAPATAEQMRKHFADLDIKVVLYLRPQWEYIESGYNQLIRFLQIDVPIDVFYQQTGTQITNYRDIVGAWQKALGADNLICLPFDASVRSEGIVSHVLREALKRDIQMPDVEQANQKFGLLALSSVRYARDMVRERTGNPKVELSNRMVMNLSHLFRDWSRETRDFSFMSQELKDRIYEDAMPTNRWLSEQFPAFDTPSFLAKPPPVKGQVITKIPELTDEEKALCTKLIRVASRAWRKNSDEGFEDVSEDGPPPQRLI